MRRITLDFNNRDYAFMFHFEVLEKRGSYIAGIITLKSEDLVIDEITEKYLTFIYKGKKYNVKKEYLDNIKYEKI